MEEADLPLLLCIVKSQMINDRKMFCIIVFIITTSRICFDFADPGGFVDRSSIIMFFHPQKMSSGLSNHQIQFMKVWGE